MSEANRSGGTLVLAAAAVAAAAAAAACGDNRTQHPIDPDAAVAADAPIDQAPDAPPDPLDTLAGTGLCADAACMEIMPGIREYAPRASFWDDSAAKRRWIYLPPGAKIDTTDMDHWVFPVGTKIWKQFTRGATRVETRLIYKRAADDQPNTWLYAAYQWNATQDGTKIVPIGVQNANGTEHDIPSRDECRLCHDNVKPTRVLGFDAIQLDYDALAPLTDLEDLIAADLLTAPPPGAPPRFRLPGTAVDHDALTYLHANCGHCHNPTSLFYDGKTTVDLRLRTSLLGTLAETPAYATTVNQIAQIPYTENGTTYTKLIIPDDPMNSSVISRMNSMLPKRFMPNTAVESVDPMGQTILVDWINSLQ
jgi:hypothetical protein